MTDVPNDRWSRLCAALEDAARSVAQASAAAEREDGWTARLFARAGVAYLSRALAILRKPGMIV